MGIISTNTYILFGDNDSAGTLCRVFLDSRAGAGNFYGLIHGLSDYSAELSASDIGDIKAAAIVSQSAFDDECFAKLGSWYSGKSTASKTMFRSVVDGSNVSYVRCMLHQEQSPTIDKKSALEKGCLPDMLSSANISVAAFGTEMGSNYPTWWGNRSVSEKEDFRLLAIEYDAA